MNTDVLNIEIQSFINNNLDADTSKLILKGLPFNHIDPKAIIEQIEAKKRCKKKLPTWYTTRYIYYPNKLNIEQTSSETTAKYKASLVKGNTMIDLTGGFGVDSFYFSKQIKNTTLCEINNRLCQITQHNYTVLNASHIRCLNQDGITAIKQLHQNFDWIYIDPSRRDTTKKKVFLLSDCTPNVKTLQKLFFKYSKHIMIKTSPLLDITATIDDLNFVKSLHVVAVNNEVKELLWILENHYNGAFRIKTVNISKGENQKFEFLFKDESKAKTTFSEPLNYLYEPNTAILKAGAFNSISEAFGIAKIHKHAHIYTSEQLLNFPGRRFKIERCIPYNKRLFSKIGISKANITTRHFPISVSAIRKKFKLKDGGLHYLFFTTLMDNQKAIIICTKV